MKMSNSKKRDSYLMFRVFCEGHDQQMFKYNFFLRVRVVVGKHWTEVGGGGGGGDIIFTAGNGLRIDCTFLNYTKHTSLEGGLIVYF